ncbi:MAG: glycosyltransferase family 9 protein [Verrucomicrobia bacterium]|nr:glycosyltransferase family 9 protein [Verrucomicrobiota bacterium]
MKRFLIIKPSSLGDIVHGLLVAQSIREQLPGCHITWIAREVFAPFVEGCSAVDRVIVFPRAAWLSGLKRFVTELRADEYDCVLDMQGLARSGLMTLLANASVKVGRSDAREFAGWACTRHAPLPPAGKLAHAVDVLLQFLPLIGLEARLDGLIRLQSEPLPPPHQGLFAERPMVLLPHSRVAAKNWPGFTELTQLLLQSPEGPPVVWSSQRPCSAPPSLAAHPRFHNLTGRTTLRQMVGLVQAARLIVVNDSGPMHIAAAVGTPLVACFGPTTPELYGPYPLDRPTHQVLRAPAGDLARLEAGRVLEAVRRLLGAEAAASPAPLC